jgi:hypothetical protein
MPATVESSDGVAGASGRERPRVVRSTYYTILG